MRSIEDIISRLKERKASILWGIVLIGLALVPFIPYIWIASIIAVMFISEKDIED